MQSLDRRKFLASGALAGVAATLPVTTVLADEKPASPRNKLALATYSSWHFTRNKYPIEKVIDHAADLGVEGVDVLHMQMAGEKPEYLRKLKRHAFLNGVGLVGLSIHQGFVSPDKAKRQRNIDHTIHCMELAHEMGIPCIRLNTGRWGTTKSFDTLMANRGIEPVLPGHTEGVLNLLKNVCGLLRNWEYTWHWKISGDWHARPRAYCVLPRPLMIHRGWGC